MDEHRLFGPSNRRLMHYPTSPSRLRFREQASKDLILILRSNMNSKNVDIKWQATEIRTGHISEAISFETDVSIRIGKTDCYGEVNDYMEI